MPGHENPDSLVARLVQQNLTNYQQVSGTLIDNLERQLAYAEAELLVVRQGLMDLYSGDYLPSEAAIRRALFPHSSKVEKLAEESLQVRNDIRRAHQPS